MTKFSAAFLLGTVVSVFAGNPAPAFFLRDRDRVVFYGDSITDDGAYGVFVEEYCRSRFPSWDLRFYNAGVGGDTVRGGGAGEIGLRLERDVIRRKPTVVTIMLGMNDGGYRKLEPETLARFSEGYRAMVVRLKEALPGARICLIRTSPFDDVSRLPDFDPGYENVLVRLGDRVSEIGREQQASVVDFGGVVASGIGDVFRGNPDLSRLLLPDRVHPSAAGHLIMGAALLRAWNAPAVVSRVEIDANRRALVATENSRVSEVVFGPHDLAWSESDGSLPMPVDSADAITQLAQRAGADLDSIDSQPLVIRGLPHGKYELRIDDQHVGAFSESELAQGVNLARYNTPMRRQAFQVRWGADGGRIQQHVERDLLFRAAGNQDTLSAAAFLASLDESQQSSRSKAATPKERHFSVTQIAQE